MKFTKKVKRWFKGLSKAKRISIYILAFILVFSTAAGAIVWHRLNDLENRFGDVFNPPSKPNDPDDDDTSGAPEIIDIDEAFRDQKVLNVLLMGFDRTEARDEVYAVYRPDTLMLASINIESGRVDVISIPRDSLVPIYRRGGGIDKINHSFYYGWASTKDEELKDELGLEYTIKTVSMALGGIPIHYYVTVDMDAVVEAVNIMGGVWYDIPQDIYDKNGVKILDKGYQRLNGMAFLRFARNRNFVMGDYQRVTNQQDLLIATFNQFKQANSLIKAPQMMLSMKNDVKTNLSLEQMMSLALFATNKIDRANIHQHVLQGKFGSGRLWEGQKNSNTYWIINNAKRAELLKTVWGINIKLEPDLVLLPPLAKEPATGNDSNTDPADEDDDPGTGEGSDHSLGGGNGGN